MDQLKVFMIMLVFCNAALAVWGDSTNFHERQMLRRLKERRGCSERNITLEDIEEIKIKGGEGGSRAAESLLDMTAGMLMLAKTSHGEDFVHIKFKQAVKIKKIQFKSLIGEFYEITRNDNDKVWQIASADENILDQWQVLSVNQTAKKTKTLTIRFISDSREAGIKKMFITICD